MLNLLCFQSLSVQQCIDDLLVVENNIYVAKSGTELMDGQPMKLSTFVKNRT